MGVIGMNLTDGDEVVGMQMESQGDSLMIVSEKGLGKCTLISEFTTQNRGGKGVKCYKITEKTGNIVGVKAVNHDNEIMLSLIHIFKIEQMLSSDYETKVKINKRELLDCIDRATLLVKEGDKKPIIMNVTDGNMELKINSFIGSMNEDIDIVKDGKDILIGFNPKFFIDALRVICLLYTSRCV